MEENKTLITETVLESNGFISQNEFNSKFVPKLSGYTHCLSWCENYYVALNRVKERLWHYHIQGDACNIDGGIQYVHQLQMALDLSGIKVVIKI